MSGVLTDTYTPPKPIGAIERRLLDGRFAQGRCHAANGIRSSSRLYRVASPPGRCPASPSADRGEQAKREVVVVESEVGDISCGHRRHRLPKRLPEPGARFPFRHWVAVKESLCLFATHTE